MRGNLVALIVVVLLLLLGSFLPVRAAELDSADQTAASVSTTSLGYTDGFATLDSVLGPTMGQPLETPHVDDSGDIVQLTTTGLAYYLPDENLPVFYNGVTRSAWTAGGLTTWTGPSLDPPVITDPRSYLYATYPSIAAFMDHCVITNESRWIPTAKNPLSTASGLAQILNTTWAIIPASVRQGRSVFDPYANIDGAAWLARTYGWTQWEVYLRRLPGC